MSIREKQGLGLIFALFSIFALATIASLRAQAATDLTGDAPQGLRLIQVSPSQRFWMNDGQIADLARRTHEQGHCGGFMDVTEHQNKTANLNPLPSIAEGRAPTHGDLVNKLLPELSAQKLLDNVSKLANYQNRYYKSDTGATAAGWIKDRFVALSHGRSDVTVELFSHKFKQPSVIATIRGRGPHALEHVVLGAHEDSVNWHGGWGVPSSTDTAPGADDDASGVATLLETFRVLIDSDYRPDRTIVFMTYAGEELGLLGSQDIAEKFKADRKLVAAVLQLDMTMYPGQNRTITMINDHVDKSLTQFTEMLIDAYVKAPWKEAPCDYACSDHASWTDAGYPSTFPFEAPLGEDNPKIHTEDDTIANGLDNAFGLHFAKLATAFAVELAE